MNTLSQRLKFAKRELTALKTAHPRGLGNLRVFRREEQLTPPSSEREIYLITMHMTFDNRYAPFPFAQVLQGEPNPNIAIFQIEDFEYDPDGMGATVTASGLFGEGAPTMVCTILSMAPVESTTIEWEIYG